MRLPLLRFFNISKILSFKLVGHFPTHAQKVKKKSALEICLYFLKNSFSCISGNVTFWDRKTKKKHSEKMYYIFSERKILIFGEMKPSGPKIKGVLLFS